MHETATQRALRGFSVQRRAVKALIIRVMMLRYGRNNIGFLWVVLEPMILTIGVLLISSVIKGPFDHGTHVLSLVLTGYMPLTMWRHTTNSGIMLVRRSIQVLYHRNLTVLDVFWAYMLLEGIGTTMALTVVYTMLWSLGIVDTIDKPGHLIVAWVLMWWLGSAAAMIITGLTESSEAAERFVQPFQYLTVPLSGIFFMVDWLPERGQKLIVYNPLTNIVEFFRDGFFGYDVVTHYTVWYPLAWCIVLTWFGLIAMAHAREKMSGA